MPKRKLILTFFLLCFFFYYEIMLSLALKQDKFQEQEEQVCQIKNKTLEEKYNELVGEYQYDALLPYHLEHSKIISRDVYALTNTLLIYKGEEQQIKENNLVINEQGLIGIVTKVNKNSSVVHLLTNNALNLSVKIKNSYGLLKYQENHFIISGITSKEEIAKDEEVYTSDLSIYPENIYIGKVKEIKTDAYGIEKELIMTPAVDFTKMKYVSVITDVRGEE